MSAAAERPSERAFLVVAALLFAGSVALTIHWCASMGAMGEMPMAGGWTMSGTWMRMPGQTWPGAAASFIVMWIAMMTAMMLPSLVPMLRRYRASAASVRHERLGALTALVAAGYFSVWTAFGAVAFALGVAFADLAMREPALARAVPLAAGAVIVLGGVLQLSAWKQRQLACCRNAAPSRNHTVCARAAWGHGLRLGLHCTRCCAGLTATLLAVGVMDFRTMAAVAAATSVERLARDGERAARIVGLLAVTAGLWSIARAALAS
jgi:predicted metal-binding membrane protein